MIRTGRPGWTARVLEPGVVGAGDRLILEQRPAACVNLGACARQGPPGGRGASPSRWRPPGPAPAWAGTAHGAARAAAGRACPQSGWGTSRR